MHELCDLRLKAGYLVGRDNFRCLKNLDMEPPRKIAGGRDMLSIQNGHHFELEVNT